MSKRIAPEKQRMNAVGTTLTPTLLEELEKRAQQDGVSVSAYVRAILQRELNPDNAHALVIPDITPELRETLKARAEQLHETLDKAARKMLQDGLTANSFLETAQ